MVAPIPPDTTKPAPSAALPRAAAWASASRYVHFQRRSSTATARRSRSASMSLRTCSGCAVSGGHCASALRTSLRLGDRLLRHGRRSFLDRADAQEPKHRGHQQDAAGHDQQRGHQAARWRSPRRSSPARSRREHSSTTAPSASPIPIAIDGALRLSSSAASSSSSRTSELARSETLLTVRPGRGFRAQSLGCAWPLQSMTLASTIPATSAAPTTSSGAGPLPPLRFFLLRLGPRAELRAARRWRSAAGSSERCPSRGPGSGSASASAGRPRRCAAPPTAIRRRRRFAPRRGRRGAAGRSALRSTRRSALFTSSPAAPRPWRCARAGTRRVAQPSSRPRRGPRRDRSRAASASIPGSLPDGDSAKPGVTVTLWNRGRGRSRSQSGSA